MKAAPIPTPPLHAYNGERINTKSLGSLYIPAEPVKPIPRTPAEEARLQAHREDFQRRLDAGLLPTRITAS